MREDIQSILYSQETLAQKAVSYTHLDVYKRQVPPVGGNCSD